MKNSSHPRWENPTIIEAVIELRPGKSLEIKNLEFLEERLQKKYKFSKENLAVYSAKFEKSSVTIQQDVQNQPRLRFGIEDRMFAYIYPEKLSVHWLGNYLGWDSFYNLFKEFCEDFKKILPNIQFCQVGVRYINLVDEKKDEHTVGYWLKNSDNYPKKLLNANTNYFIKSKWPLTTEKYVQICIAEGRKGNTNSKPLLLDIDVIKIQQGLIDCGTKLFEVVNTLHEEVYDVFKTSISKNYEKLLKKEK